MSIVYLLRHGETEWNRDRRAQGRGDSPLTPRGISLARAYGERLRESLSGGGGVALHASPLGRTLHTARLVAESLALDPARIRPAPLLMELDCGHWEGLTAAEMERHSPDHYEARTRDRWRFGAPGGESHADVHVRVCRWLDETPLGPVSVVVAHGIVSRVLRGAYLGLEPDAILDLPSHRHGRLFRLADGGVEEWVLPEEGESAIGQ